MTTSTRDCPPGTDVLSPYVSVYMARSQAEDLVKWAHLAQAKLPRVAPRNARTALRRIESALKGDKRWS